MSADRFAAPVALAVALFAVTALGATPAPERLPPTMRAVAIDRTGGPEVLTVHQLPVPTPGPDEILIALDTAGVGPWDLEVREKLAYYREKSFPVVLGVDGSGTVAAVGTQVRDFKVGDAVYAYAWDNPQGGFYAEYVAVPAKAAGHVPPGMSLRDAGAAAVTALTALQGVDDALHLKAGETLIIHGASGAVGTLAVQFAKLRGVRVLASASGADGVALARQLGAEAAIDGHHGDLRAAAHGFAPAGVDAVLALAGGDALEACIDALKPGGRVAYPSGVQPPPKTRPGVAILKYDALTGPAEFARLGQAITAAQLSVPIAAEYPLADAARAHERMAAGHVLGKVVLRIR
jgi:NADPH:quinone reductase-like Zn-dependent oxidoreductase